MSIAASAVIYCICKEMTAAALLAVLIPVLAHELGHVAVLLLLKAKISGFAVEPRGLCIQYSGVLSESAEIAAALSGPAAGMLYALMLRGFSLYNSCRFFQLSSDMSLLLSLFNLLPVLPLDGGTALLHLSGMFLDEYEAEKLCFLTSLVFSCLILLAGLIMMLRGRGQALLAAGLWLAICQSENRGIVKKQKVL